jgi:hypothetical protein
MAADEAFYRLASSRSRYFKYPSAQLRDADAAHDQQHDQRAGHDHVVPIHEQRVRLVY